MVSKRELCKHLPWASAVHWPTVKALTLCLFMNQHLTINVCSWSKAFNRLCRQINILFLAPHSLHSVVHGPLWNMRQPLLLRVSGLKLRSVWGIIFCLHVCANPNKKPWRILHSRQYPKRFDISLLSCRSQNSLRLLSHFLFVKEVCTLVGRLWFAAIAAIVTQAKQANVQERQGS